MDGLCPRLAIRQSQFFLSQIHLAPFKLRPPLFEGRIPRTPPPYPKLITRPAEPTGVARRSIAEPALLLSKLRSRITRRAQPRCSRGLAEQLIRESGSVGASVRSLLSAAPKAALLRSHEHRFPCPEQPLDIGTAGSQNGLSTLRRVLPPHGTAYSLDFCTVPPSDFPHSYGMCSEV